MTFQLPNLPNYNVQQPQIPSAMEQYGKMLQLKSLLGQQQMQPLQQQEAQQDIQSKSLQNQQQQLQLQSQQAMIKAWSDPDFLKSFTGTDKAESSGLGFDPDAMTKALVSKGVMPQQALALSSQFIDRSQKMAETAKAISQTGEANAAIRTKGFDALHQRVADVLEQSGDKQGIALSLLANDLTKNPQLFAGVPQDDVGHVLQFAQTGDLAKLKAAAGAMDVDRTIAEFHQKNAEATKAEQGVIPANGGLSPDSQQKVAAGVAETKAEQPLKIQQAVAQGQAVALMQQKIAEGSNAALAKVPAHLVAPATEAATKAGTDFAQAQSVSQRLQAMMDAAKKGNVVSYQLIPQEGALQVTTSQGVHRINMAEIQNYGGGSLWQSLQGHLGKALTGKSIPESVLSDMSEMQKIQEEGSQTKYENTLKTINQTYGSSFKPVEMTPMKQNAAPAAAVTKTYMGHSYAQQPDGSWKLQ